ncbi:MAG: hypothetical protein LBN74_08395 [Prevotella sp.]|jgi:hypothetical protein|nr:hypothetical protein [Prevotella sp.]
MKTCITILFILFAGVANAQTFQRKAIVEINSKFTIKLVKTETGYDYTIINKEPYNKTLNISNIQSLFPKSRPDEIQGILTYTKFGDEMNTFLVLQSGLENPLKYSLYVMLNNNQEMENVPAINLFPDISSTEIYPLKLAYIAFSDFENVEEE